MSIDWSTRVANPDALGEVEKRFWNEVETKIRSLLEELKKNGRIETIYTSAEHDHLFAVLDRLNLASRIHNVMSGIFQNSDSPRKFIDANRKFGVDEEVFTGMFVDAGIMVDLLSTELFKLLILFHIKGTDDDLSMWRFSKTMQNFAPDSWKDLKQHVDNDFRNAIAHGTLSAHKKRVLIYHNAKLVPLEEMELAEFMMRGKRQNVLFHCLAYTIAELKGAGWFT